nr:hypothetical protein [Tanacetum cinerariifolium]
MGSEAIEVPVLKEKEFVQITVLGVNVFFSNGIELSFTLRQVPRVFPRGIHRSPTKVKILLVGFHVRLNLGGVVFTYTTKVLFGENLCPVEIHLSCFLASLFSPTEHAKFVEFKKVLQFLRGYDVLTALFDTRLLKDGGQFQVWYMMDDPNITMEEYIKIQAENAQRRDRTLNWETATYSKIYCDNLDLFQRF